MAIFFDKSVVSPTLIGRADSVASFERVFAQLVSGQPSTILVLGEAGIGKSRLVTEMKARVDPEQVQFLQGACYLQDRTVLLGPLVDGLRALLLGPARDDYVSHCAPFASELVKILPDLAFWLPEVRPTPALEPEQEKRRLFAALAGCLLGFTAQRPIVLILEDVHWSDESSLEFLLFLLRHRGTHPFLLLLTYRHNEVSPSLQHFLTALKRERVVMECVLSALDEEEVHALVREIFPSKRPVQRDFLQALYRLTEGNPFFVEEILKALLANGDIFLHEGNWNRKPLAALHIPDSVAAAVQQRFQALSDATREMLALAAVIGKQVEFPLLQALMPHSSDELLTLIETAIAAQLLVQTADGQVTFRHALTRQAVYEQVLLPKRKAMHFKIGQALEDLYAASPEAHLADLASHFYRAEAWPQALVYGQKVGAKALALHAPYAAVEYLTYALEATSHVSEITICALANLRGQAHEYLSNFSAAHSDYEQALEMADRAGSHEEEWQNAMALGRLWGTRDYPRADAYIQRAINLAQQLADPHKYMHSLNLRANWLTNTGRPLAATAMHEEALAFFQQQAATTEIARTLQLLALNLSYSGDMVRAVSCFDQAIECLQAVGDKSNTCYCLALRCGTADLALSETVFSARAPLARCQQDLTEALALADAIEWRAGRCLAFYQMGMLCATSGLLGQALVAARSGLAEALEMDDSQWVAGCSFALGTTYLLLLNTSEAISPLETALALVRARGSAFWIGNIAATLAQAYLLAGDLTRAETTLSHIVSSDQAPRTIQERRVLWVWGLLALAQDRPALALQLAERLIDSAPGETQTYPIVLLWKLRGDALCMLGQAEEAVSVLEEAVAEAQVQGARSWLWQIQRSLGRAYALVKQRLLAQQTFAAARETIATLASSLYDEQQRAHFMQAALATLPKELSLTTRKAAKEAFGGLSEREREIVPLVVQGKTNREIAETFSLSQRTVDTYLGRIYTKLDISTRAQLAAWAVDKGLL